MFGVAYMRCGGVLFRPWFQVIFNSCGKYVTSIDYFHLEFTDTHTHTYTLLCIYIIQYLLIKHYDNRREYIQKGLRRVECYAMRFNSATVFNIDDKVGGAGGSSYRL